VKQILTTYLPGYLNLPALSRYTQVGETGLRRKKVQKVVARLFFREGLAGFLKILL